MRIDPLERLLPVALRAALARRELIVRRAVAGTRHGVHRSSRSGVGHDFRDFRAYAPGDELRRLDWRAAARSDRLVVRQTESEDELDLVIVADGSGAFDYGEDRQHKWLWSGMVAAALASLALRQGDRVGYAIGRAGNAELAALEPSSGRDRLRVLASSWAEPASGDCPWPALLDAAAPRLRRRSLVLVISDFLDPGGVAAADDRSADEALMRGLGLLRAAGHDVVLAQLLHRDELSFPWDSQRVLELRDARARRPSVEGPGASLREGYLERLRAHLGELERSCERGGLVLERMVSDEDPAAAILGLLGRLAGIPSDGVEHLQGVS